MDKRVKQGKSDRTERIIATREKHGVSSKELAEQLNIAGTTYRHYESEKTRWTLERIESIAKILDVSPVYLLYGRESDIQYIDEKSAKILKLLSDCSDKDKDDIIKIIEIAQSMSK